MPSVLSVPPLLNEHGIQSVLALALGRAYVSLSCTGFMTLIPSLRLAVWFIPIIPIWKFPPPGVRLDYRLCESLEEILKFVRFNLINLQGAELEENVSSSQEVFLMLSYTSVVLNSRF